MKFTLDNESEFLKTFVHGKDRIELHYNRKNSFTIKITEGTPLTQHYFIWFKLGAASDRPPDSSRKTVFHFTKKLIWNVESEREYFDSIEELALLNFESEEFFLTK